MGGGKRHGVRNISTETSYKIFMQHRAGYCISILGRLVPFQNRVGFSQLTENLDFVSIFQLSYSCVKILGFEVDPAPPVRAAREEPRTKEC